VVPENFQKNLGQNWESSAISIGTTGTASSGGHKKGYKKTRLCNNWEMTGGCPYGKVCHFAHGQQGILVPSLTITIILGMFNYGHGFIYVIINYVVHFSVCVCVWLVFWYYSVDGRF
jgi:hypothetical protein